MRNKILVVMGCVYSPVKDQERDICGLKLKNSSNLFKCEKQPLAFSYAPGHLNRSSQPVLVMPHFQVAQSST
jgi:hypothetical protein